jgi:hypothetical protein
MPKAAVSAVFLFAKMSAVAGCVRHQTAASHIDISSGIF